MGSADIQSLADLGNSFEVIKTMRFAPFSKETVFQLGVITLVPLAATAADDDLARGAVETSVECGVLSDLYFLISKETSSATVHMMSTLSPTLTRSSAFLSSTGEL